MDIARKIGSNIKFIRTQKQMSIAALSEAICKSQATVYKYENGQIAMDIDVLYEIAQALHVPVTSLLYQPPMPKGNAPAAVVPAFFAEQNRFFAYTYDGRQKKICESLLECIGEETAATAMGLSAWPEQKPAYGEKVYSVRLYMNLLNEENLHICEDAYTGRMTHYGAITNIHLQNYNARLDQYFISIPSPYIDSEAKWALAFGVSSRPLMPTAGKMLLSKNRLEKTKELSHRLLLSKEDIRLLRLYNFLVVM